MSASTKRSSTTKRTETVLKKSQSNHVSNTNTSIVLPMALKRRSTGSLRRRLSCNMETNATPTKIWRAPGFYEIPNVLGSDCFLKPNDTKTTFELRQSQPEKNICKRPWLPAGICTIIPQLPPLVRPSNTFERHLRKTLPTSVSISCLDPHNKYNDFCEIGTGVNGAVMGATHRYKPWKLAIKRCKLDNDHEYRLAIVRELKIMASGHSNLIRLREVSLWRDDIWMVMDLQQCSVFAVLCQRGLPEQYAVYIANETLKALIYLHSKGYIHRDIKCENLLIGWHGEIKLADFGLATRLSRRNRERLGTSKWMAPEVIREQVYNEKIDLWSLGITVIEMMDRVPPHYLLKNEKDLFAAILNEPSPTFSYSYPTMYMRGLVAWLLDENSKSRPSAKDVAMELKTHIETKLLRTSDATEFARFVTHVMSAT
ncbi:kinase-like domain-containing protein [Halteromyces radiatus]|uniref:kinase-like domain-containing protein n=1 Tax=Halteromyces radiatus TaxID=101107 RepID=UPI0022208162|nr:kinase-like domain-containing protein [Halteromyces radiatus]KAI8084636.1 kinase-like domain-containing protein [Halteromyces radiatus]